MANKYLAGIDIGTIGTKAILFDLSGKTVASGTEFIHITAPERAYDAAVVRVLRS